MSTLPYAPPPIDDDSDEMPLHLRPIDDDTDITTCEWFERGKRRRLDTTTPSRGLESYLRELIHPDIAASENALRLVAVVSSHMHPDATEWYGEQCMPVHRCYELIQSAALARGASDARLVLAIMMYSMDTPPVKAVYNVLRSATHGPYFPAIIRVAWCLYNGVGTEYDPLGALHILRQVAFASEERNKSKEGILGEHIVAFMRLLKRTSITLYDGTLVSMDDVVAKHASDHRVKTCATILKAARYILVRFEWPPMRNNEFFNECE